MVTLLKDAGKEMAALPFLPGNSFTDPAVSMYGSELRFQKAWLYAFTKCYKIMAVNDCMAFVEYLRCWY